MRATSGSQRPATASVRLSWGSAHQATWVRTARYGFYETLRAAAGDREAGQILASWWRSTVRKAMEDE